MQNGSPPDNFIDPSGLGMMDRRTLLEACRIISLAQDALKAHYGAVIQA
jgi:signal-transduction protein with cAMP-binding, CBS, and nucleotidyltransferase domain